MYIMFVVPQQSNFCHLPKFLTISSAYGAFTQNIRNQELG